MPTLHNVRDAIDALLAALGDGTAIGDGVLLRLASGTVVTIERVDDSQPHAVLSFDPPPELSARRGVFHLRCALRTVTIGRDEVHLAIDGWFDRRWPVES